jgi:DNA polymerase-4
LSCERLTNSKLNGLPLIIGGGDRGVVASCSMKPERLVFFCNAYIKWHAPLSAGKSNGLYSKLSHDITKLLKKAPIVEKQASMNFTWTSGMDRFHGCYQWTNELSQSITKETGLPLSFALSVNKTVSKIGTSESKPTEN